MFQDFQTPEYAGFWLRFAAYLIDTMIIFLVFVPLSLVLVAVASATSEGGNDDATMALLQVANTGMNLVSIVVVWLYSSLLESSSWQGL